MLALVGEGEDDVAGLTRGAASGARKEESVRTLPVICEAFQ